MTAEGPNIIITTPDQSALERMAQDGSEVHTDPGLLVDLNARLRAQVVAHIRAYEALPAIELEGEI